MRNSCRQTGSLFGTCLRSRGHPNRDVLRLVGVGSEKVWLEMEVWTFQHLVAAEVAEWVETPRELLVMGSGKGWRPDSEDHSQSGSAPEPIGSRAQSTGGDHSARAPVAKGTEL